MFTCCLCRRFAVDNFQHVMTENSYSLTPDSNRSALCQQRWQIVSVQITSNDLKQTPVGQSNMLILNMPPTLTHTQMHKFI